MNTIEQVKHYLDMQPLRTDIQMLELLLKEIPTLRRFGELGEKQPAVNALDLFEKHLPAVIECAKAALEPPSRMA